MPTKAELMQVLTNTQASDIAVNLALETAQTTNSALMTVGAGMIGVAGVAYVWYRRVTADKREDSTIKLLLDEMAKSCAMYRENFEAETSRADKETARADRLLDTIEQIAQERNEAVKKEGELKAKVDHLQGSLDEFRIENKELRQDLADVRIENKELRQELVDVRNENREQSILLQQVLVNQARLAEFIELNLPEVKP